VTTLSNSTLPHVRTDVATYFQERNLVTLNSLLLNKYVQLGRGVYSRWSGGYYEEMFGGAGGQILYLPGSGNWATDLTVDWLRQRDPYADLSFTDYSVVTALAATSLPHTIARHHGDGARRTIPGQGRWCAF